MFVAPPTKPRAALKHNDDDLIFVNKFVAPPTKPRAALKQDAGYIAIVSDVVAPPTKPRAALKLEVGSDFVIIIDAAPPTKPRAALKRLPDECIDLREWLHHPQSRVRHERPHRLAALATSPIAMGEAKIP